MDNMWNDTLFCYFNFTATKFSLLDVLDAEVSAAMRVDLRFVPGGGFIVGAVGVRCSWEMENIKGHYCGEAHKWANYEILASKPLRAKHSMCVFLCLCMYTVQTDPVNLNNTF